MSTHEKMNKLLVGFALEELSEAEANQVRTHLSQCEMCRREYNRLKTLLDSTEHVGQITADENIYESARQSMLSVVETNYQKPIFPASSFGRGSLWRTIMKSRITKLATAASVLIALFMVIFRLGDMSSKKGVVWADVVQKTEDATTGIHREKRICWRIGEDEPWLEAEVVNYASTDYGIVEELYNKQGQLLYSAFLLKNSSRVVLLFPTCKKYIETTMNEEMVEFMKMISPSGLVKHFTSKEYKELGFSVYDGHQVEGFEVSDKSLFPMFKDYKIVCPIEDVTLRFWVDVETSLPVYGEAEFTTGAGLLTGFQKLKVFIESYDYQWGAEIVPDMFEVVIPDDYERINSFAKVNRALLGLGIFPVSILYWKRRKRKKV